MIERGSELDPFNLIGAERGLSVVIGESQLGPAASNGHMHQASNELPVASLTLDQTLLAGQPVDYFGTVHLVAPSGPTFTGNVISADPNEDGLDLECKTHPSLSELKVGRFESFNCDFREVTHLMTRTAGLAEEQINIEGFDGLPLEVIETLIPLSGIEVDAPVRLGPLLIMRPEDVAGVLRPFEAGPVSDELRNADCVAVYREVSRKLLEVEVRGLRLVESLLGWVAARARYGLAILPTGEAQHFSRTRALNRVRRGEVVLSRGLETGRSWLRELVVHAPEDRIRLESSGAQWTPPDPTSLSTAMQLSLIALRRASELEDVLQRIQALWESIEFYVAGVKVDKKFDPSEAKRVRKSLPADLDPELRERALNLLAMINDPPLMAKLREATRKDGVPMTEAEFELLKRVRDVRNNTVHGRQADEPSAEDVDYAISVVARLVMHGIERKG